MTDDFEGITVFLAIAAARNFRIAAERLGVTRSAVSQALQRLEDRVGVALVQRTTRSVRLTEAGERFHETVCGAARQVGEAIESVREVQTKPSGLLKIAVSSIAERFISGKVLAGFMHDIQTCTSTSRLLTPNLILSPQALMQASGWVKS